jgi:hypothetical protein
VIGRVEQTAVPADLATEISHHKSTNRTGHLQLVRSDIKQMLVVLGHGQLDERAQKLIIDRKELDVMLLVQVRRQFIKVEIQIAQLVHTAHYFGGTGRTVRKKVQVIQQMCYDEPSR